jgi:acyl-CoA hydrolase/RimJ/RimL family protein N-acetyltransferase
MSWEWLERYAGKIERPDRAIARIQPGRRILIGSGAAEPAGLVEALIAHGDHLADNEIVHLLTLGPAPYVAPALSSRFRHVAFFIGPNTRQAVREGRADYLPVFLSEIPDLIRSRRMRIDVALVQVSPPDRRGYVSLGVSVDVVRAAVDCADLVIAEVNQQMPRTLGDSFLHVDRIHSLIPVDTPLFAGPHEQPDETALAIGRQVARLVPDGACIQTGIGQIPDAVLGALFDRKDLGVHTEMLSDGIMKLADAGVINGRKKQRQPGKMVASFIMGSRALYEWAHEHPAIEMRPSDYTNDPGVIRQNDDMISINSALSIDLTGQVASDTLDGAFYSGIGGQVDFIRGAARSRGGKAIIALRSTAKRGSVSRICPALEPGAGVVTSRGDVRYVVTEYGIADLWGRSVRERAMALISVAHPDFRGELLNAAKQRHYVFPDQTVRRADYPWREARIEKLADGTPLEVRPLAVTDEPALRDFLYRLSDESTYKRYFGYRRAHPHAELQKTVDLDYAQHFELAAILPESREIIGLGGYTLDPATQLGDLAFVVRDDWQQRGLGMLLMRRMSEIGGARGLGGFQADVLAENTAMMRIFERSGLKFEGQIEDGVYHLVARFGQRRVS